MAKENVCVFCGEAPGAFRSTTVICGSTIQFSCKACAKEMEELNEEERCRRALRLGLAQYPQALEERLAILTEAEEHRLTCLRCGGKLQFGKSQALDNSPYRDSLIAEHSFVVLPAFCKSCGKIELYDPGFISKNKFLAQLLKKDTEQ